MWRHICPCTRPLRRTLLGGGAGRVGRIKRGLGERRHRILRRRRRACSDGLDPRDSRFGPGIAAREVPCSCRPPCFGSEWRGLSPAAAVRARRTNTLAPQAPAKPDGVGRRPGARAERKAPARAPVERGQPMAAPVIVLLAAREVAAAPAASLAPLEAQPAASTAKTAATPTQIARCVTPRRACLQSAHSGATACTIACSDDHLPSSPVPRAPPRPAVSRTPTVRRCLADTAFLSGEVLAAARRRYPRTCAFTTPVLRTRIARRAPAFAAPDILGSASPDRAGRTTTAPPALLESACWTQSVRQIALGSWPFAGTQPTHVRRTAIARGKASQDSARYVYRTPIYRARVARMISRPNDAISALVFTATRDAQEPCPLRVEFLRRRAVVGAVPGQDHAWRALPNSWRSTGILSAKTPLAHPLGMQLEAGRRREARYS